MLGDFMTHTGGLSTDAEYATLEGVEHHSPNDDILNRVANGEGPKEMASHLARHMSKDQAETWMTKGHPHSWTSEHFMNKFGDKFSPETHQAIVDAPSDRHYSWVQDTAKAYLKKHQEDKNENIKYRAPSNPELG